MAREYQTKKTLENLEILKEELPKLKAIFEKDGAKSFNIHSKPATKIGKAVGNPSAYNKDAFNETQKYLNNIESELEATYRGNAEVNSSFDKAKKNFIGTYQTLRKIENKNIENKFITGLLTLPIIASIFFLSPNITGNTIGNLVSRTSNYLGIGLLLLGIIGIFIRLKK